MTVHMTLASALAVFVPAASLAIDGLAPSRPHEPGKPAAEDIAPREESGNLAGRNIDWWGFSAPASGSSRPSPGQARAEVDDDSRRGVSEMAVVSSAEGDEVTLNRSVQKRSPTVHGEAGAYGGAYGGGAYGTAVIEDDKAAITISGERSRGWWP